LWTESRYFSFEALSWFIVSYDSQIFIECWEPAVMFYLGLGRDLSQDFTELLKYVTGRSSVQK